MRYRFGHAKRVERAPGLWALLGVSAALQLRVGEDLGLIIAALVSVPVLLLRGRRSWWGGVRSSPTPTPTLPDGIEPRSGYVP